LASLFLFKMMCCYIRDDCYNNRVSHEPFVRLVPDVEKYPRPGNTTYTLCYGKEVVIPVGDPSHLDSSILYSFT
jgi:hypothetical protein